jgi:tight adherence protein C
MTAGVLIGVGLGLGVLLIARGLWPAPPSVAAVLADYDAAARSRTSYDSAGSGPRRLSVRWERVIGGPLADTFAARGWLTTPVRSNLAVLGWTPARFLAVKSAAGVIGLIAPALLMAALAVAGAGVPVLIPAWISLTGGVVGFLMPDVLVRSRAAERRRDFRVAVGAYLDLVAMRMASGAGLSEALGEAARLGDGPAFVRFRGALADARTDGLAPAAALGRLGEELALPDLVDTAARLSLVDTSGAQAEASLRAQAATLRDRELTDIQGTAAERSQSMLVAQVVLGFGFLLFLGYPAVAKVLAI